MNRRGFLKAVTAALAGAALGPVLPTVSTPATATQIGAGTSYVTVASCYLRNMHLLGMMAGEALNREVRRRIQEGMDLDQALVQGTAVAVEEVFT